MSVHSKIIGLGAYLPEKVLTNADLEKMVDTSDEWITKRTGIKERRIADENTFASDLATQAAKEAVEDAGISPDEIDLIIVSGVSPDMYTPSTSCIVQKNIGAKNAAAFDINAACSGFIFGINTANQFIENGIYETALVIGADTLSKITEYQDRRTCVLFGDGAGAVVLRKCEDGSGIQSIVLGSDGAQGDVLTIAGIREDAIEKERRPFGNTRTIWMDGSEVFKFAVKTMASATEEVLEKIGKTVDDAALIIPHQANKRIIDGAAKRLKCSEEKIFSNVHKYGNMSAACVPIALYEAVKEGKLKQGDLFVLVGFGGGLTWGSSAIIF